jgi:hypothetical protein
VITDTVSRTTTPSSPIKPSSQDGQPATPATIPSTHQLASHAPHIPHPDEIQAPEAGFIAEGFYVISVGQEVGIFTTGEFMFHPIVQTAYLNVGMKFQTVLMA